MVLSQVLARSCNVALSLIMARSRDMVALGNDGSLYQNVAILLLGSLSPLGALRLRGSLPLNGALNLDGFTTLRANTEPKSRDHAEAG